jgi:hypothetical protein
MGCCVLGFSSGLSDQSISAAIVPLEPSLRHCFQHTQKRHFSFTYIKRFSLSS